jgi:hypothetical protein
LSSTIALPTRNRQHSQRLVRRGPWRTLAIGVSLRVPSFSPQKQSFRPPRPKPSMAPVQPTPCLCPLSAAMSPGGSRQQSRSATRTSCASQTISQFSSRSASEMATMRPSSSSATVTATTMSLCATPSFSIQRTSVQLSRTSPARTVATRQKPSTAATAVKVRTPMMKAIPTPL